MGTGFKVPDFRQRYFDFTNSTIGYTVLGRDVAFDRLTTMGNNGMLQNVFIPLVLQLDNIIKTGMAWDNIITLSGSAGVGKHLLLQKL